MSGGAELVTAMAGVRLGAGMGVRVRVRVAQAVRWPKP